jgi:hypothetical protein
MNKYIGTLQIKRPKHISSSNKVLNFQFSRDPGTDKLTFISPYGNIIPVNSILYTELNKTYLKHEKRTN